MAQKDITIRIKTVETELKQSLKKIEKLEKIINKLNSKKVKLNTSPAQRAAEKLRKEIEKGNKIVDKLFDASRSSGFGNSIAKVNSQLSLVTKSFNAANSAADRQTRATALIAGNLKKMRMEATAFAQASGNREALKGGAGNVGTRLKEIRDFPKTILAGNQAMNILNGMLELAEVNSKEFLDISKAIGEQLKQNAQIQEAADKASGVSKKKQQLKDNQRTTQRIKAIKEQTLNIERRIQDSTLNQATKDKLINNLKRSGVELDRKELELAKQINIETQRNLTMQEKMQRRRGRIAQSALIGGGFPLLFGGGPLQAAAGALGGGIGEAFSPGGGFAGSIAATAFIGSIQKFNDAAREVGNALKDANLGLEKLEQLGHKVDESTKQQIQSLLEVGKIREAEAIVNQRFAEIVGPKAVKNLQDLDTEFDELQKATSKLFLTLASELAPAITAILGLVKDIVSAVSGPSIQRAAANLDPQAFQEATTKAASIASPFGIMGNKKLFNQLLTEFSQDIIKKATPDLTTGTTSVSGSGSSQTPVNLSPFELKVLNERIALQKLSGNLLDKDVEIAKRRIIEAQTHLKIMKAEGDMGKIAIIQAERLLEVNRLNKEIEVAKGKAFAENVLKPQMDALARQEQENFDAGAALGKRLAAEVKIINNLDKEIQKRELLTQLEEAKTIEEKVTIQLKLREVELGQEIHEVNKQDIIDRLKKIETITETNKLLTEQKQIAKDIKTIFAVEMSAAIKGLITGANSLNDALRNVLDKMADAFLNIGLFGNVAGTLTGGKGLLGKLFSGFLANGGPAKAGNSYIVGEKGPELFTPGVSGMVSPNSSLGGSTNVVVNVDAANTTAQGDNGQAEMLGKMLAGAVQDELLKQQRPGGILYR